MDPLLDRDNILRIVAQEGYVETECDIEVTVGGFGPTPVSINLPKKVHIPPKKHRPLTDAPVVKTPDTLDTIIKLLLDA